MINFQVSVGQPKYSFTCYAVTQEEFDTFKPFGKVSKNHISGSTYFDVLSIIVHDNDDEVELRFASPFYEDTQMELPFPTDERGQFV